MIYESHPCYLCKASGGIELIELIQEKPPRETDLNIKKEDYYREVGVCTKCGVYNNFHKIDLEGLYQGNYNAATYSNQILSNYKRIMNLPYEKSDNKHRVERIVDFLSSQSIKTQSLKVLDVGSGLCVFLGEFQSHGIEGYSVDPDAISADHAKNNVQVKEAYCEHFGDFETKEQFDLITFNKVLEHVENPIDTLGKAQKYIPSNGLIYIELPDGEKSRASEGVFIREEFFLEHYTVFTESSIEYLADQAGFTILEMGSIHEPSDKYSIYAFLRIATNQITLT